MMPGRHRRLPEDAGASEHHGFAGPDRSVRRGAIWSRPLRSLVVTPASSVQVSRCRSVSRRQASWGFGLCLHFYNALGQPVATLDSSAPSKRDEQGGHEQGAVSVRGIGASARAGHTGSTSRSPATVTDRMSYRERSCSMSSKAWSGAGCDSGSVGDVAMPHRWRVPATSSSAGEQGQSEPARRGPASSCCRKHRRRWPSSTRRRRPPRHGKPPEFASWRRRRRLHRT